MFQIFIPSLRKFPVFRLPKYGLTEEGYSEFQQALIRVVILSITLIYFISRYAISGTISIATEPMVVLVGIFLAGSFLNLLTFRAIPDKCHTRRITTLAIDVSVLSWGLHIGGDLSTICFSIYLRGFDYLAKVVATCPSPVTALPGIVPVSVTGDEMVRPEVQADLYYVGLATDLMARMKQHLKDQHQRYLFRWWALIPGSIAALILVRSINASRMADMPDRKQ